MGAYKENPRYNQVQTRLCDYDYEFLQAFANSNKVSIAKAASVIIEAGIKMMQRAIHD